VTVESCAADGSQTAATTRKAIWPIFCLDNVIMQTIGGLSLLAALAICYMLYFRSQDPNGANTAEESRPIAIAPAGPGDLRPVSAPPHSVYKGDMDRAHVAAHQMQAEHAEADSY
jgi:hypothetical protein